MTVRDLFKGLSDEGQRALTECARVLRDEARDRLADGSSNGRYVLRLLEVLVEHIPPRAPSSARSYVDEDDLPQALRLFARLLHSLAPYLDAVGLLPPPVLASLLAAEGVIAEPGWEADAIRMVRREDWEGLFKFARGREADKCGRDLVDETVRQERIRIASGPYSEHEELIIRTVRQHIAEQLPKKAVKRGQKEAA